VGDSFLGDHNFICIFPESTQRRWFWRNLTRRSICVFTHRRFLEMFMFKIIICFRIYFPKLPDFSDLIFDSADIGTFQGMGCVQSSSPSPPPKAHNQICTKNKAYLTLDKLACVRVLKWKIHQPKCYIDFKIVWTQFDLLFSSCRCQHGD